MCLVATFDVSAVAMSSVRIGGISDTRWAEVSKEYQFLTVAVSGSSLCLIQFVADSGTLCVHSAATLDTSDCSEGAVSDNRFRGAKPRSGDCAEPQERGYGPCRESVSCGFRDYDQAEADYR